MRRLILSRLIRIYTICHSVLIVYWDPYLGQLFWPVSKLRRVRLRISGMKGLIMVLGIIEIRQTNCTIKSSEFSIKILLRIDFSYITKTRLFKYTRNFTTEKWKFSDKNIDFFFFFFFFFFQISVHITDCGYSLEPPRRGGSNEYPKSMFLSRNKKNNVHLCM